MIALYETSKRGASFMSIIKIANALGLLFNLSLSVNNHIV